MKRAFNIIMTVTLCLAMLVTVAACGEKAGDKAYKDWADNSLPKVEEALAAYQTKAAEASGDNDALLAASLEFRAVLEGVTNGLAAIDQSTMSDTVKKASQEQLTSLETQLQQLDDSIAAMEAGAGAQQEVPEDGGEEVIEDGGEEVVEDGGEEVVEE